MKNRHESDWNPNINFIADKIKFIYGMAPAKIVQPVCLLYSGGALLS